jgi:hypothetical protein
MENLKTPVKRILLNSIDYTKVGAYTDAVTGVNILSFKEYGVNIPYVAANFHGAKSCSNEGTVTSQEIELSPACPCIECDWEYGVTITKSVKYPGVNNNQSNQNRKSYVGTVSKITCTAGVIDDTWKLQAEDDIITQIYNDTITGNDPVNGGGTWVKAVRSYKVTASNPLAATDQLNFTLTSTGVTTTIVLNGGATVITMVADLNNNAIFAAHARAVAISATEYLIYGLTGADIFTIADGAGATTITVDYRRIWFTSLNPDVQFGIMYDSGFATTYKRYQFVIDGTAAAATANSGITLFIDGVAHNVNSAANVAAMVTAIQVAVGGLHEVYSSVVGNDIYVSGTDAVSSLWIAYSLSPSNYATYPAATLYIPHAGVYSATGTGSFPILTGRELMQLLAADANQGSLAQWSTSERPDPTVAYCMYWFQVDSAIPAIHGASHWDSYKGVVEVYIKSSIVDDAFLYPVANATALSGQAASLNAAPATTAVVDFEELLQAWAGTGTIAQATGVVTGGLNPNAWTNV